MQEAGDITIQVELPDEFIAACNQYGIKPEAAIESFVAHLSLFSFFAGRIDHDGSRAADVVFNYFKKNAGNYDLEDRDVQIGFIKELLHIISDGKDISEYEQLIDRWYRSFFNSSE